jgi:hypothetical protein
MKNRLILEWEMPQGDEAEAVRDALQRAVTQCVRANVANFESDRYRPSSIFIHCEHEELTTISSLTEPAYIAP